MGILKNLKKFIEQISKKSKEENSSLLLQNKADNQEIADKIADSENIGVAEEIVKSKAKAEQSEEQSDLEIIEQLEKEIAEQELAKQAKKGKILFDNRKNFFSNPHKPTTRISEAEIEAFLDNKQKLLEENERKFNEIKAKEKEKEEALKFLDSLSEKMKRKKGPKGKRFRKDVSSYYRRVLLKATKQNVENTLLE